MQQQVGYPFVGDDERNTHSIRPVNPFEIIMQNGLLVDSYPSIIGSDIAGEIAAVGAEVTRFQKGDRVIAMADGTHNVMTGSERDTRRMAFQLFVTTSEKVCLS